MICKCGCDNKIEIKKHHKYYGIPEYIHGHNPVQNNSKHGEGYGTKLYMVWDSMKQRCLNPNHKAYKYYGEKGIIVCPEWTNDYVIFRDWALSNGYKEGLFLDRIKNDLDYNPKNCRWVTVKESNRNQTRTKMSMDKAKHIRNLYNIFNNSIIQLSLKYDVSVSTIYKIIQNKIWKN